MVPTILLAVHCLLQIHYMGTSGVWCKLNIYFLLLLWYGGWSCLARTRRSPTRILADVALIALLGVMALSMVRRSWIVIMILFTGMYAKTIFEQFKAVRGRSVAWRVVVATRIVAPSNGRIGCGATAQGKCGRAPESFARGHPDRSVCDVLLSSPAVPLVLGLGPRATYYYGPGTRLGIQVLR